MLDFTEEATNDSAFGFPKLPKDIYTLRVASGRIKRSNAGGLAVGLELRVEDGMQTGHEHNGMVHFEDFWLGTAEDPDAEDPATQRGPMRRNFEALKLVVQKTLGKPTVSGRGEQYYQNLIDLLTGRRLRAAIDVKHEPQRQGKDGRVFEARDVNRISAYYGLEDKLPGQRMNGPAAAPRVPRSTAGFTIREPGED